MDYNIHKICRVCLEEGALTSIYSTEFAMMPSVMLMLCAKVKVYKTDGLPSVICNNCIYRLGVAYHFKQECENSDMRLRQYLGMPDRSFGFCDAATNTENAKERPKCHSFDDNSEEDADSVSQPVLKKRKRRPRYQRIPKEQHKKRGPKPVPKLPQTCYDCNKTFKCAAQLQMHIRTHSGEKPFSCSYCPRSFAQKYNLEIHIRTHTNERPFQCEICSKRFSALGNFQAHQKIHTGIRDVSCPICSKSFYTGGDLSKHMVTHTAIKNHRCDICGKSFSRQRDMQTHKQKKHAAAERSEDDEDEEVTLDTDAVTVVGTAGVENFKCPDCDKEFATADSLSLHFRTHDANNLLSLTMSSQMAHAHTHFGPTLHPHTHTHPLTMQANVNTAAGMGVAHAPMAHMLPPPPPPPATPSQGTLTMMHQRLHPY